MENNNKRTYEVKDVIEFVISDLGNIAFPANILSVMQPEQIMAIKQMVIDPIENSRRNLAMCVNAINQANDKQTTQKQNAHGGHNDGAVDAETEEVSEETEE